ncbi:MAG: nucleotide exchange factor GrpE [Clostridiales bacterium]|nr:nucleotide exchange factor GrpE [Clostridiales bacterium]
MAENKEEILEEEIAEDTQTAAEEVSEEEVTEEETAKTAEESEEEEKADTAGDEENEASEEKGDGKKGFFKKKKDKKDEQIEELTDQVKRQMAEFDNFRKRTEKEKTQMYDMGARSIVEKILPVIDNFERGLAGVPEENKEDAFVVGMDKTYRQMLTELETVGVTPIEALGKEFDPEYHNAVMQVESEEYESGVVAQELQKGYMYKDSVVRHSMVAVVS